MRAMDQARPEESTRQFIDRVLHEYLSTRERVIEEAAIAWLERFRPRWMPAFILRKLVRWAVPQRMLELLSVLMDTVGLE